MGCNNSKVKTQSNNNNKSGNDGANNANNRANTTNAGGTQNNLSISTGANGNGNGGKADYKSLRQVVLDAEAVLTSMAISDEEKKLVALSFINTLSDVLRQSYRLKREGVAEAIEDLCNDPKVTIHRSVIPQATPGAREEFLLHLISSWIARNPTGEHTLPSEVANEILIENQITPWKSVPMGFGDCYRELLRIGDNAFTNEVFSKYSEGSLTISSQQFLRFLLDCQHSDTASMRIAEEKTKERFGAVGTRFTFALYLQSLTLNSAQEPRRGGTVWQDMTQPLPRYMVRTTLVDTKDELECSLASGARALVIHCHQDSDASPVMAGDSTLESMLQLVKEEGFTASNYPLMLCLAPEVSLTISLQERIAKILTNVLGDEMLAKGMMFEGATLADPKFSPAALQHRVLILGSQAPLKPYVGFLVADMNRNGLGVKVTNVVGHTPAAKAGVQKGDWFTHINNEAITSKSHLKSILAKLQLGEEFTMRRENLDDVTIVVGGTIEGDASNSKELSELVFLKFSDMVVKSDGAAEGAAVKLNGTTASHSPEKCPWDICMQDAHGKSYTTDYSDAGASADLRRAAGDGTVPTEKQVEEAASRESLTNHFSFATLSAPPHGIISAVTHAGVQLICTSRSTEEQKWARGFFTDNGECGYVQKAEAILQSQRGFRIQVKSPPPHFYNWRIADIRATMFGEGTAVVDSDNLSIDVSGTDDLSVCTFLVTLMPPSAPTGPSLSGDGVVTESSVRVSTAIPTSPLKAQSDAIATPVVLSVSFPIALLRLGIRAFTSVEEKDEGKLRAMPHYPILSEITALSH